MDLHVETVEWKWKHGTPHETLKPNRRRRFLSLLYQLTLLSPVTTTASKENNNKVQKFKPAFAFLDWIGYYSRFLYTQKI